MTRISRPVILYSFNDEQYVLWEPAEENGSFMIPKKSRNLRCHKQSPHTAVTRAHKELERRLHAAHGVNCYALAHLLNRFRCYCCQQYANFGNKNLLRWMELYTKQRFNINICANSCQGSIFSATIKAITHSSTSVDEVKSELKRGKRK